jgi:hypothetical protein
MTLMNVDGIHSPHARAGSEGNAVTSIPTWLVVVVPILAALLSGAAGVAGALLGGRAARLTAERTATLAHQNEQRRWSRDRREDAYRDFLAARDRFLLARWRVRFQEELSTGDGDGELEGLQVECLEQWRLLVDTMAEVTLVGSRAATESARIWLRTNLPKQPLNPREMMRASRGTYGIDPGDDAFLALVRKELGVGD